LKNPLLKSIVLIGFLVLGISVFSACSTQSPQQPVQSKEASLNTSVTQEGIAAGAGMGDIAVTLNTTVLYNPWVASAALLLGGNIKTLFPL
jgi:DHA1 family putative efflux transporter-like MFS transporter